MITKDSQNQISVDGVSVQDLAREFGTPLYVYSSDQLKQNISNLKNALSKYFGDNYRIQYAVKANTNPQILNIIREMGLACDCSSPYEVLFSQKAEFDMSSSTYTGNSESLEDFKIALDAGMIINLDDYKRLDDLLSVGTPHTLSFRVNPGIGRGGFEGIVTGGNDAKFGIPYEQVREAYKHALDRGVKKFGIHMMTGSNILEPFYFAEITQKLLYIIEEHLSDLDIEFEFINIGGGLGIPYENGEEVLNVDQTFKLVSDVFHNKVKELNIGNPTLVIEPGRYIAGNMGVLLSEVTHVKESYRNYLGLDSGMTTLIRPALYGAYHQIELDGKESKSEKAYRVCGQICENSDIHPVERHFENPAKGDIAVAYNCGAYSFVMSSNYNNRPRPAEVLVSDSKAKLIRKRESFEDLLTKLV